MTRNFMQQDTIYAFDFDGVICDSAVETSITGWKAARCIWTDMNPSSLSMPMPSQEQINQFKQVRPLLETGYEAILIMRLLHFGKQASELCKDYEQVIKDLIQQEGLQPDNLKILFGETRDHWIRTNEQEWLAMNPLFPTVADKLRTLPNTPYIITTKQERFVNLILQANGIQLEENKIFGMDRQMSKQDTLLMLVKKHANQKIVFIEDRVQTLIEILQNPKLSSIALQLVSWGYNTKEQRELANDHGIEVKNKLKLPS